VDPSPAKDESEEHLYWMTVIDGWHRDFGAKLPVWATGGSKIGSAVLFDMRLSGYGGKQRNQLFTEAAELVAKWIDEEGLMGPLRHDGNPILRTHVHNARMRPNPWGTSLGKVTRDSSKLVDLAVCMVGAVMGARIALNSGKLTKRRTGKAMFA
jgi:phage terminase large subunit-like protein